MEQPSVAILLAVYDPKKEWLEELLRSLDAQTYPNIHLYARNDASPHFSTEELKKTLEETVSAFPFTVLENETNLGSNRTFENLIKDASEDLIAFCDQDDIWLPEKIANTVKLYQESPLSPTLVCTDLEIMDGEGNFVAPDMEHHRRRHIFLRGEGIAPTLIYRNYAMGCTTLLSREKAVSYLPIPNGVVHDHYIAFRAALDGAIDYLPTPQMRYRVYGGNQTGVMTGVVTKEDYYRLRIGVFEERLMAFSAGKDLPQYADAMKWLEARKANFHRKKGGMKALWKSRKQNFVTTIFELVALRLPDFLFRFAICLVQKRIL